MQIDELGEFDLIDRIIKQIGSGDAGVVLGAGDDTAALRLTTGAILLATCDSQVEGRHFRREGIAPERLGRRLAAVNLSDIAAMGGRPRWALASFVLPAATDVSFVEAVCRGLIDELRRFGAHVVGGNLTGGDQIVLDLTLLGEASGGGFTGRSGARPGDAILVTGNLGAAAAGRAALDRHLQTPDAEAAIARQHKPEPRVSAGLAIAASGLAHAMIDVSDGLSQDLGHICDASGVDVIIEALAIPIERATRAVARALGLDPIRLALTGGEDYELLCVASADGTSELVERVKRESAIALTRIGTVLPTGQGRWLVRADGQREPLGTTGWQHFGPGTNSG